MHENLNTILNVNRLKPLTALVVMEKSLVKCVDGIYRMIRKSLCT